jgi:signal transduction histidine kinase
MNNPQQSPEQQLSTLINELRTPVEIIRGFASVMRKGIASDSFSAAELLNEITTIAEAADKVKDLLDEMGKP